MTVMRTAPWMWVRIAVAADAGCSHQPKRTATHGTRKPVRPTLTMLPRNSATAKGRWSTLVNSGVPTNMPNRKTMG
jgi:hypothetical protein